MSGQSGCPNVGDDSSVGLHYQGILAEPLICMWRECPLEILVNHWHLQHKSFSTDGRSLKYVLKYQKKTTLTAAPVQAPNSPEMGRFMPQAFCKLFLWIVIMIANIGLALYGLQSAPTQDVISETLWVDLNNTPLGKWETGQHGSGGHHSHRPRS